MRRWLGIARALGLVVAGIAVALLLIEGGLRAMPQYLPRGAQVSLGLFRAVITENSTREKDPTLAYKMKPNTNVLIEGHPDYRYHVKTYLNFPDAGFRGNVVPRPLVGVALGDSFTFGQGVEAEEAWPEMLSQLAGRNFANLGVIGHGPPQYTSVLKRYGLPLGPKIVLYAIYPHNDLADAVHFVRWQQEGIPYHKPLLARARFLATHSRLYQLLRRPKVWEAIADPRALAFDVPSPMSAGMEDIAWETMQHALLSAKQLTQQGGATLVLLLVPTKRQSYSLSLMIPWDDEPTRHLLHLCEASRLRCLDLAPRFQEQALAGEQPYFRIDGHWNAAGHRLAARTIYEYLVSQRLLGGTSGELRTRLHPLH